MVRSEILVKVCKDFGAFSQSRDEPEERERESARRILRTLLIQCVYRLVIGRIRQSSNACQFRSAPTSSS